jgi:hypothetical protein
VKEFNFEEFMRLQKYSILFFTLSVVGKQLQDSTMPFKHTNEFSQTFLNLHIAIAGVMFITSLIFKNTTKYFHTHLGYVTVIRAACARQGCSATDYFIYYLRLAYASSDNPALM